MDSFYTIEEKTGLTRKELTFIIDYLLSLPDDELDFLLCDPEGYYQKLLNEDNQDDS